MRTYLTILVIFTLAIVPFPTARSRFHIPTLPQRATVLGYDRTAFGSGWAIDGTGCTTRERIVVRDLDGAQCAPDMLPVAQARAGATATGVDPFTGDVMRREDIEVDHILPVSAAWDLGAHRWDDATRIAFYNDPLNLIAVSSAANQAKSDKLPSEWMPPNRRARCAYGTRIVEVATQYRLPLPAEDVKVIKRACSGVMGLVANQQL